MMAFYATFGSGWARSHASSLTHCSMMVLPLRDAAGRMRSGTLSPVQLIPARRRRFDRVLIMPMTGPTVRTYSTGGRSRARSCVLAYPLVDAKCSGSWSGDRSRRSGAHSGLSERLSNPKYVALPADRHQAHYELVGDN